MAKTSRVYLSDRPLLTVDTKGGKQLGNCYYATYYEVTSTRPLDREQLQALRDSGFLGSGQEFYIRGLKNPEGGLDMTIPEKADWKYKPTPTGCDTVPCSEVDDATGKVLKCPSINPYSGKEDGPTQIPYYVYEIESRVDSSD
jgi:hypothetical protein